MKNTKILGYSVWLCIASCTNAASKKSASVTVTGATASYLTANWNFGASTIQFDYDSSFLKHHRQSEDCLTLNIFIASKRTKQKKKPVIVFFHHGDFTHGADFIKIYPDSVGVTFNYRLGVFGFIDFSEIPGGEDYPDVLNLGLLDQIAALRWIKENIFAFGGDPERITVMGFESGALSLRACLK